MSNRYEHYRNYLEKIGRIRGRHSTNQAVLKEGLERSSKAIQRMRESRPVTPVKPETMEEVQSHVQYIVHELEIEQTGRVVGVWHPVEVLTHSFNEDRDPSAA